MTGSPFLELSTRLVLSDGSPAAGVRAIFTPSSQSARAVGDLTMLPLLVERVSDAEGLLSVTLIDGAYRVRFMLSGGRSTRQVDLDIPGGWLPLVELG